ncbi:efflux RND transporter periplasmic adaptor subunit [Pedobacter faecalis]|uniref:efflux RND transporter periplasmic adaptor subunit n=1 Tax=Pedobacter faecalis TaxID=3041495 RepID=UPI002550CEA6|nr:efflux RND transporter periplasmic adaptor subunit [Pedobacter sp. ELA7]
MKHYTYIGTLSVMMLMLSCSNSHDTATQQDEAVANESEVSLTPAQAKNIGLETGRSGFGKINQRLKFQGKIDVPPQNLVSVSIPLGGYVKSIRMLPGMPVRKGQIIAVMEDPQYISLQQDYLNTKNRLNYASKELARQRELNSSKANSDKTYQLAETEYNNLQVEQAAQIEKLKLINVSLPQLNARKISNTVNIYSPITGYVSKVSANTGKYVTPSDVILELVDPADIHLNLTVFERDLSKISRGQRVWAFTNARPEERFETKVILVGHTITEGGIAEIHCHFDRYDKRLLPGMYMNAELELENQKAQFVPEGAVVNFEGKDYVFIQTATRKFIMQEVKTGETSEGKTAVMTDLANKTLVTKGAYSLLMKLKNTGEEE